jgi:hypothetical protein
LRLQSLVTSASGQTYTVTLGSADWHGSDIFSMMVWADVALAEGDVQFIVKDTVAGVQLINLPALTQGLNYVELAKGATVCTAVIGYGFKRNCAKLFDLRIDNIVRSLAAESVVLTKIPILDSVWVVTIPTLAATANTLGVLTAGTDFELNPTSKRISFKTDQSANQCLFVYGV